jgi:hypothetical protein
LFANGSATVRVPDVGSPRAALSISWIARYVHAFEPGWSSSVAGDPRAHVPAQLIHAANLTYSVLEPWRVDFALDLSNLTDARVYDFLGVQKAGRAAFFKVSGQWASGSE